MSSAPAVTNWTAQVMPCTSQRVMSPKLATAAALPWSLFLNTQFRWSPSSEACTWPQQAQLVKQHMGLTCMQSVQTAHTCTSIYRSALVCLHTIHSTLTSLLQTYTSTVRLLEPCCVRRASGPSSTSFSLACQLRPGRHTASGVSSLSAPKPAFTNAFTKVAAKLARAESTAGPAGALPSTKWAL